MSGAIDSASQAGDHLDPMDRQAMREISGRRPARPGGASRAHDRDPATVRGQRTTEEENRRRVVERSQRSGIGRRTKRHD